MRRHAFPKEARLLKRAEFLRVQNTGRRVHGGNFMLFIRPARDPASHPRLGITVTTKIHKRSHVRNRIKRHLREVFRHHQHEVRRGIEIVVSARTDCSIFSGPQLQEEIVGTFRHAGVLQAAGLPQNEGGPRLSDGRRSDDSRRAVATRPSSPSHRKSPPSSGGRSATLRPRGTRKHER